MYFQGSEGPDSILQGFTIRQGSADDGGGIFCESGASPTITGNVITESSAVRGAGIYCQNVFSMVAQDVTPAPYNQPPYPQAGDTATDGCTVTAFTP